MPRWAEPRGRPLKAGPGGRRLFSAMSLTMTAAAATAATCPARIWGSPEGFPVGIVPSPPRHFTFEPLVKSKEPPRPRRRHRRVLYPPAVRRAPPTEEPNVAKRLLVLLLVVVGTQIYNTPADTTPEVTSGVVVAPAAPMGTAGAPQVAPAAPTGTAGAPQVAPAAPTGTSEAPQVAPAAPTGTAGAPQVAPAAPMWTAGAPQVAPAAPMGTAGAPHNGTTLCATH
ncbi:radiation-inducible immediate-early gene IEX-1 [Melanerpes formicivorus]|uniref:radiation-inducible immediate-early gene IEX-1 n=1 Tax=Melanerpes formicivorus TaxID=211600 RepID=UPI00358E8C37